MSRYIDAEQMKTIKSIQSANFNKIETIIEWIDEQPTADVRENVRAEKSISGGMANSDGVTCWFECSACGGSVDISDNFCRHCGADMRGEL